MDKLSLFKLTGIPDPFGVVLLVFSFILFLAPYFSGADFGLFKIPASLAEKKWLKVIGPVVFVACVLSFIPLFKVNTAPPNVQENVAKNPASFSSPSISLPQANSNDAPSTLALRDQPPGATSPETQTTLKPTAVGTYIPSINATFAGVRFYPSATGWLEADQRHYQASFPLAETRYVCWEVTL